MPCTEPESLGDAQIDSTSLGAHADGRKEEQLETSLAVQPDDMTGSRTRWMSTSFGVRGQGGCRRHFAPIEGENTFLKQTSG